MDLLHPDSYRDGKDVRVELQIPPSLNRHFKAAEETYTETGYDILLYNLG